MHVISVTAIQAVQAILAPALGISAVGLLLLGLMNRYSGFVARIRLLNDEKRVLVRRLAEAKEGLPFTDNLRYMSIKKQTDELLVRSSLIRNSILSLQTAVGMFVLTSLAIGLNLFVGIDAVDVIALIVFMAGMAGVLVGIIFAAREVYRSFKIVLIEVRAEE